MVREIVRDQFFLMQKSEPALMTDQEVCRDLLDTLAAKRETCAGLAANMIGVRKRILAYSDGGGFHLMINPEILSKDTPYETQEGCLSLSGLRKTLRYQNIEVKYLDGTWKACRGRFSGFTAQIIQHEMDHFEGRII